VVKVLRNGCRLGEYLPGKLAVKYKTFSAAIVKYKSENSWSACQGYPDRYSGSFYFITILYHLTRFSGDHGENSKAAGKK
jgi:hypothetical protein